MAGAWLVKITPAGDFKTVTFKSITKGAVRATDLCETSFPYPGSGVSSFR